MQLARSILRALDKLKQDETLTIPRFDKALDDRCPEEDWSLIDGPVDLIILEGWCVGARTVPEHQLCEPINSLESEEDKNGTWRKHVNEQLKSYEVLFDMLDALALLQTPDFKSVYRWRTEQERKLALSKLPSKSKIMTNAQIVRFVQHFERITLHNMKSVGSRADVVMNIGVDHQIESISIKKV